MDKIISSSILLCLIFFTYACNKAQNKGVYGCLLQWDTLLQEHPKAIRDSLAILRPEGLSQADQAYYGLLKTIADDKNLKSLQAFLETDNGEQLIELFLFADFKCHGD